MPGFMKTDHSFQKLKVAYAGQNTNICHISIFTDQRQVMAALTGGLNVLKGFLPLHFTNNTKPFKCQSQHNARQINVHLTVIMQI